MISISEPILHSIVPISPNIPCELENPFSIETLVPEMRLEIWVHLIQDEDWKTLSRASQVNHLWKLEIEHLWKRFCEKKDLLADEKEWTKKGKNWKWLCQCRRTSLLGKEQGFGCSVGAIPGTLYEGEWKNNQRHGVGRFVWNNNDRYVGEWCQDYKHGHGIMLWTNGDRYDGFWDHDLRQGKAIYSYANGGKYEGEYEKDERHGKGKFFWPNGDYYQGTWKSGGRYGKGILFKKGKMIEQDWNESSSANYSKELPPTEVPQA